MNLHEFQAKDLFRDYGISVSKGVPIRELSEVRNAIKSLNGDKWVMKVQVHAGGRGKAGGVELVSSIEEAEAFVEKWLGKNLVTFQTDEKGQPINIILIEECSDIEEELYLGAVIDRTTQRLTFMASEEGGVNIEEVAASSPESIYQVSVDPFKGPSKEEAEGRIIITPHSAFYSPEGLIFLREKSLKTCLDHIEGIRTANCVNESYLIKPR